MGPHSITDRHGQFHGCLIAGAADWKISGGHRCV